MRQADGMWLLPTPGGPEDQAADLAFDEPQRAQLGEAFGVQVGLEAEVELVQRLVVGQAGHLQSGLVAAALEHTDF